MTMERVCPECGLKTEELTCPTDGEMTLVVKTGDAIDTLVGRVIGSRYRILEMVGQGGFGAVYKAQHTATGDTLAIKTLRADVEGNQDVVMRFRQEAKATSKLKHPNTVRVFDFGQMDDGNLFLAMEFLDGRTMTDVMRAEAPLDYKRLVHMALQVLKSLSEAHSKGLIHRDLKPDNIYLQTIHGEDDFVRVLDFGIAKSVGGEQQDITSTGAVIGTPKYMSPEQARGQTVDARTDLYSLGVILYEGLSGTPPFVAETPLAMILRRVTEEPPRVHDNVVMPTPIGLCDAVLRALRRRPEDRYASADEMAAALSGALDTPKHMPEYIAAGAGGNGAGGSTQQYAAGEPGGGDITGEETMAFDTGVDSSDVHVVVGGGDVSTDDATAVASSDEILDGVARIEQGRMAAGPPASSDPDDIQTMVASLPAGLASASASSTSHIAADSPAAPAPAKGGKTLWIVAGMLGIGAAVGFGLFGLISGQSVNAKANSGKVVAPPKAVATVPAAPVAAPEPAAPAAAPAPVPKQAKLTFVRDPAEASIEVDGVMIIGQVYVGKPGKHAVTASLAGYEDWGGEVVLQAGDSQTIQVKLTPKKAPVAVPKPRPIRVKKPPRPKPTPPPKPKPSPPPKPKPKPPGGGLLID